MTNHTKTQYVLLETLKYFSFFTISTFALVYRQMKKESKTKRLIYIFTKKDIGDRGSN